MLEIPNIVFSQSAWKKMCAATRNCGDAETGGLLLGRLRRTETGRELSIARATGPGPRARRSPGSFRPDVGHYRQVLQNSPGLIYCGEWHSHPPGNPDFSERDLIQAQEIVKTEGVGEIVCPVCVLDENGKIDMRCFYISSDMTSALPVSFSIIDKVSARVSRLIIEDRVLRSFLNSRSATRVVAADFYPQNSTAHIFTKPLRGEGRAVLVNTGVCKDLDIYAETSLAVTIAPTGRREKFDARAYDVSGGKERALSTEIVSLRHDQLRRNRSLLETSALRGRRVAIIGLGSIGGAAALELARAGVDKFTLVDPDRLSIANLCRHVCDLSDLGALKVDAIATRISRVMPYAKVRRLPVDINASPATALKVCGDADIVLVSTDTERSRLLINWAAYQTKTTVVFAGLLERAIGGRVWRVLPKNGACYQCHPSTEDLKKRGPIAYSEVESERDITVEPGLGNDIAFITQLAVRYTIDTLRGKGKSELPYHMVFWFNHAKQGTKPLTLYRVEQVPARKNCQICGNFADELSAKV